MSEYQGFTIRFADTHKGIGVGKFPDRKKYCLFEMTEPNNLIVLAYFQSAECVAAFERVLDGILIARGGVSDEKEKNTDMAG